MGYKIDNSFIFHNSLTDRSPGRTGEQNASPLRAPRNVMPQTAVLLPFEDANRRKIADPVDPGFVVSLWFSLACPLQFRATITTTGLPLHGLSNVFPQPKEHRFMNRHSTPDVCDSVRSVGSPIVFLYAVPTANRSGTGRFPTTHKPFPTAKSNKK